MNLALDCNLYNINYIFFYDPVKNTVMDDSKFIRIIYSDENIILNGLYLKIVKIDNSNEMLNEIDTIEKNILEKYNSKKGINLRIREQLSYIIKKNLQDKFFILKISGIWETDTNIGITYKFLLNNN